MPAHGSNQNSHPSVLVRKPLCNQFIHYHISSRRVFGINLFKLCNFAIIAIECSFATVYRGSIMARIHRWSVMIYGKTLINLSTETLFLIHKSVTYFKFISTVSKQSKFSLNPVFNKFDHHIYLIQEPSIKNLLTGNWWFPKMLVSKILYKYCCEILYIQRLTLTQRTPLMTLIGIKSIIIFQHSSCIENHILLKKSTKSHFCKTTNSDEYYLSRKYVCP